MKSLDTNILYHATNSRATGRAQALRMVEGIAAARTFDTLPAVTMRNHGVDTFFTRDVRDFKSFGWFTVIDPLRP